MSDLRRQEIRSFGVRSLLLHSESKPGLKSEAPGGSSRSAQCRHHGMLSLEKLLESAAAGYGPDEVHSAPPPFHDTASAGPSATAAIKPTNPKALRHHPARAGWHLPGHPAARLVQLRRSRQLDLGTRHPHRQASKSPAEPEADDRQDRVSCRKSTHCRCAFFRCWCAKQKAQCCQHRAAASLGFWPSQHRHNRDI